MLALQPGKVAVTCRQGKSQSSLWGAIHLESVSLRVELS